MSTDTMMLLGMVGGVVAFMLYKRLVTAKEAKTKAILRSLRGLRATQI